MPTVTDLTFKKALVTRQLPSGESSRHRRVRFVIESGMARIFEYDGTLTKELRIVGDVSQPTGRSASFATENGETWTVEAMGCNCGGG